nr:uncharacterized mitochondrial protein AtMg00810-like [Tanacetum cinerariifolium]
MKFITEIENLVDKKVKNTTNDEPQSSCDAGNKDDNGVNKDSGIDAPEKSANGINDVNTVRLSINIASTNFDIGGLNINTVSPIVSTASPEATHADFLGDKPEGDISNINTIYQMDVKSAFFMEGLKRRSMIRSLMYLTTSRPDIMYAYHKDSPFELVAYTDSDYAGASLDRKSTTMGCQFLGRRLISWKCKKQTVVATSTTEAEYVAAASCRGQMDVKSTFLYEKIEKEVYVCQPLGYEDSDHPDKFYKVVKAIYDLHQAPRAWYEALANYLLSNRFHKGKIDQTLLFKRQNGDIFLVHVYIDDIIFGSTKKELCNEFERLMKERFQMSSMGKLTFFLGLQVKKKEDGILFSHDKYVTEVLRKFNLLDVKTASTPVDTEKPLVKDADGVGVDV